jgi:anti-sigma factor RsiW
MCEFEARLIAWIDGELEPEARGEMERHLEVCEGCSAKAAEYREVSRAFAAYVSAQPGSRQRHPARKVAIVAGAVAAAAAVVTTWLPRPSQIPPPAMPLHIAAPPAFAFALPAAAPALVKRLHRAVATSAKSHVAQMSVVPVIEIAIPADAMFAPGAFPPGFAFPADLSIANDGFPEALRVRPANYVK